MRFSFAALAFVVALAVARPTQAQVLARPGWAGSGVTIETWWRRAVFYRIDVPRFQDSTGDGRGELAGVTERLDYLQSLGVDAIIVVDPIAGPLATPPAKDVVGPLFAPPANAQTPSDGFDELTREAADHHLRVLVALPAPTSQGSDATAEYLAHARSWLNRGAAGLYVPTRQLIALNNPALAAYLVHALRGLTNSFPGERILLADAVPDAPAALASAVAHDVQLTAAPPLFLATPDAASLRGQMLAELPASATTATLWQASRRLPPNLEPAQRKGLDATLAAVLLASRTAVLIDYGQELGEQQPGEQQPGEKRAADTAAIMQWTPTNLTRAPKPAASDSAGSKPGTIYGAFHPYIKPLPRQLFPPPPMPDVELSNTPPPVDPNSLPGFTKADIDPALAATTAPNAATANVAVEDADPHSLLNLYRRLIQLHHENATLRNGTEDILNFDADDTLLWLRRAPAGTRTSTTAIVACNLSGRPFALSLDAIAQLHLRRAALRNLLSGNASGGGLSGPATPQPEARNPRQPETTRSLTVAPYSLFLGEVQP